MKVEFHFIAQCFSRRRREHIWPQNLLGHVERRHHAVLLVHLGSATHISQQLEREDIKKPNSVLL